MQTAVKSEQNEYAFEVVQEVRDKMQRAESLHQLIQEDQVKDLSFVDVSSRTYCYVKRGFDIVLSLLGLIILVLPMLLIAAAIYVDDPGEVFFSQYRVGRYGKRFKLYKFRTMKQSTPKYMATAELQESNGHITRLGRVLRRSSLDEIPQLINVLKGDMSLIGPRPLISDEYEIHAMRMRFGVYNICPGITGLAQINGRDMVTAERKLRLDVEYLHRFGFWTDIKILLSTMPKILTREGIEETAPGGDIKKENRE